MQYSMYFTLVQYNLPTVRLSSTTGSDRLIGGLAPNIFLLLIDWASILDGAMSEITHHIH
jgi:hypothetical protein